MKINKPTNKKVYSYNDPRTTTGLGRRFHHPRCISYNEYRQVISRQRPTVVTEPEAVDAVTEEGSRHATRTAGIDLVGTQGGVSYSEFRCEGEKAQQEGGRCIRGDDAGTGAAKGDTSESDFIEGRPNNRHSFEKGSYFVVAVRRCAQRTTHRKPASNKGSSAE
eukprot:1488911-Pyramimonas_sp.AAC.1